MKNLKKPARLSRKAPSNQTGGTAWGKKLAAEFSRMAQSADMKKLILLNFPYIIAFYMVEKAAWLYRHCNGDTVVDRLMVLFMNFGLAYKSVLPSFHPFDMMVGLVGAAALKAVIYFKGKNAKKYRQGEEYGSARWGNQKDIEPFIDPVFENNVILTQTERLMMSGRPKHPKYARNKNVIVIGGSGSGKTRFYVKPNLMQMPQKVSYVVTDPKGTIIVECGKMLSDAGYKIKVLNTINFKKSMRYNPFHYIRSEKDILKLVNTIIANTKGDGEKSGEDFWIKAERLLYCALIGYIWYEAPEEEQNFSTLLEFINASEAREDDENFKNAVDELFEELEKDKPEHFAVRQYKKYKLAAGVVCSKRLLNQAVGKSLRTHNLKPKKGAQVMRKNEKITALYERLSRDDFGKDDDQQRESNSISNQKELIQRYISCKESLQNVPVMDFVDDGYTGSNFDRPGFQQMMDGVRNGKIDTIIVKDLSRFGRDYIGVGEYMEQIFPLLGVRLIAINDNYDSNNYKGTTLGMDVIVSNLVNTMYCRDAGKKLRTANQVKWRKGITTASAAPFGYQFDPDKKGAFIVDPPAAKIVRRIFDLAILGLGTREIAMMLNDENVPVPSVYNKENKAYGKETTYTIAPVILWDSSRVWKILTAYVYTGAMVLGKTKTLISGKSIVRTVPKGQQFITEGTHEAIVGREEFEKAQLVIKSNSHKVMMGGVDFPLKGKVRCGNCRRVMAHNFKQAVPTFWCREGLELVGQTQCTSEVFQVSDIENAVFQALKKELSLLDVLYGDIQKEEQGLKEAHKKASRRKTLMEQELKNLKGEKMRMYEEYAAGTLLLDTYKQKKQECDRRISEVQEQIEQSKVEESTKSVVPGTVRAAAEQAENFLNGTRLTASMVSAFIENVFVYDGGRIVVRFKYEQSIQDAVKALHTG